MEDSIKAQQSAGYAWWAKLHNLKQAANSLNFITEHQIDSYEGLESRLAEISAANDAAASALKDAERRLGDMALLIKNLSGVLAKVFILDVVLDDLPVNLYGAL